jgi:putative thioredoxin
MTTSATISDVTAESFEVDVIQASRQQPVVVDFWAPWCGPCHQLSPILERVAAQHVDDVRVVKLNVDTAPQISQGFGVRGIPAVKAFRDGAVVAEFTGVQSEAAIHAFFDGLVPTEADRLFRASADLPESEREATLRSALEAEPGHRAAVLALAELLLAREEDAEARALLARLPADADTRRLLAQAELSSRRLDDTELDALRSAAAGGDAAAALQLGSALAAAGEHEEALTHLLAAVRDPDQRDEAREAVLAIFALLGDHELVRTYRPKLAAALF